MIQRIQPGNFNSYRVKNSNVSKPQNMNAGLSHAPSFKSSGDYLYEETESLINRIRELAIGSNEKNLTAVHPDGTKIIFTPEKRGMNLKLADISKETRSRYGLINRAEIETRNNCVISYSKYPTFMLCEMDEGEVDTLLQKYLPELL